jgi:hypothetical protein
MALLQTVSRVHRFSRVMLHMRVALVCAAPWLPPASVQPYPVKPVRMVVMKWPRPCADHCHRGLDTLYAATGQWEQARTDRG